MFHIFPDFSAVNADYLPTITLIVSFFLWWELDILFEKHCSMNTPIRRMISLLPQQQDNDNDANDDNHDNHTDDELMAIKMSKRIGSQNLYRIKVGGSTYFVKTIFSVTIFIILSCLGINWAYSHFLLFDKATLQSVLFKNVCSVLIAFYLWEITISRKYAAINTSTIIHHWVSALFGALLQIGIFLPYATLYAYIGVALAAPVGFILGFRAQYSSKYPDFTRKWIKIIKNYYCFLCFINISLQILLLIHGVFIIQKTSMTLFVFMIICICAWLYDDIVLIKALDRFSKQRYEAIDDNLNMVRQQSLIY